MRHPRALLATLCLVAAAITTIPARSQTSDTAATRVTTSLAPTAAPVAARFDVDSATRAYMAQLSPEARARSDAYFEGGYWLLLWGFLYGLAVAWLLLGTRLSARMRDVAERATRRRALQTAIYAAEYIVLTAILGFPLTLYRDFFREHQYALSNQNFIQWMRDEVVGLAVGLVLGTLALVIIYAVIRKVARSWWIWGAGVAIVFLAFVATIAPVYIAPLFNTYRPLPESQLRTEILSLARANGIPANNVYEFNASKQSKRISANVSGMFGTVRISVNDNLMNRATPAEVKAVLGHEMGHYVLDHVYTELVFFAVLIVIGFALVQWAFARVHARYGGRWDIRGVGDVAGLPLLVALFSIYTFAMTPVFNTITRTIEAQADAFGLNAAREPDGFALAAVQLSEYRKMHPGPIEELVFFDHPSGWNRIHRAMVWKAEHIEHPSIAAE